MLNETMRNTMDQIPIDSTVYDSAGDKVGTVAEYDPQAGYLLVKKGWLFVRDIYIPANAVASTDTEAVYLRLRKDDLQDDVYANPPAAATTGSTGYTIATDDDLSGQDLTSRSGDIRIPVREEELAAGKRQAEQGTVRVHKDVVEEEQAVNVPLRQERVTVERVPYTGDDIDQDALGKNAFVEDDIDVPVMGEEAVVGKRVRGVEEVRIHKDVVTDQERVSDTVRKERVTVDGVDDQGRAPVD
jgi:uncharacterized protein (TIGR02271 family)